LDESTEFVSVRHALDQLGTAEDAELLEVGARGWEGVKGLAFLTKLAESNAHAYSP
jgi:hypothetical protein